MMRKNRLRRASGPFLRLLLCLLACLSALACLSPAARAQSAPVEHTVTLRYVDSEDASRCYGTASVACWGCDGDSVWIYTARYAPSYCELAQESPVEFRLGGADTLDVPVVFTRRLFPFTYALYDADDLSRRMGEVTVDLFGKAGDRVTATSRNAPIPYGWDIFWEDDAPVTLGKDTRRVLLLKKQRAFPIEIRYVDAADGETVWGASAFTVYGMEGQLWHVQPSDGDIPAGTDTLDSCECPVTLGTDTVATFPVARTSAFTVDLLYVDAADAANILWTEKLCVQGFKGRSTRIRFSVPDGWLSRDGHWTTIDLGKTSYLVVKVAREEAFPVTVSLVNDQTDEEMLRYVECLSGARGEERAVWIEDDVCPDGWEWRGYDTNKVTLGTDTELRQYLTQKTTPAPEPTGDTFPILIHWVRKDTMEEVETRQVVATGRYGDRYSPSGMSWPDGYQPSAPYGNEVYLGLQTDITRYILPFTDFEMTLRGVNALDPSQTLQTTTIHLKLDTPGYKDSLYLPGFVTPPAGYALAKESAAFTQGVTTEIVYPLMPATRYANAVRFVDATTGETVETREAAFEAANAEVCIDGYNPPPPQGYTLLFPRRSYTLCGRETQPLTVFVVPRADYPVEVTWYSLNAPNRVIGTQRITLHGMPGQLMYLRQGDAQLEYPDGWGPPDDSYHEGTIILGRTATVRFPLVRSASAPVRRIALPASLVTLAPRAFEGASCTAVVAGNGLQAIGARAFADCADLSTIRLPASVADIAEDAFAGCPATLVFTCPASSYAERFALSHGFGALSE